jgi:hypothetical protein
MLDIVVTSTCDNWSIESDWYKIEPSDLIAFRCCHKKINSIVARAYDMTVNYTTVTLQTKDSSVVCLHVCADHTENTYHTKDRHITIMVPRGTQDQINRVTSQLNQVRISHKTIDVHVLLHTINQWHHMKYGTLLQFKESGIGSRVSGL